MSTDIRDLGTILSIWAHPDDETYLAGGLMAAARDNGQRVVCALATAGELGTSDEEAWPPARLDRVRRWEAAIAMEVLGVDEHHIVGLPDGGLPRHDRQGQDWADQMLADVQPDTILTFGPNGITYHPDHLAVHRWVTRAWRERGDPARLFYAAPTVEELARFGDLYEEWDMYMSDQRPEGVPREETALHLRLEDVDLDRKHVALSAMATQTGELIAVTGAPLYREMIAEEAFVEAVVPMGPSGGVHCSCLQCMEDSANGGTRSADLQSGTGRSGT